MERLRIDECQNCKDWRGYVTNCFQKCMKPFEALEEFNRYKDLEEQGLLLKLPCKVGDMVYAIEADEEEFEHFHCGLKVSKYEFDFWMIPLFGKCVFLTQTEAEEALKRLEVVE